MTWLKSLAEALFGAIVGGVVEGIEQRRREADLKKLGYAEGEIARSRKEREIIAGAREIENRPSGGIRINIDRL